MRGLRELVAKHCDPASGCAIDTCGHNYSRSRTRTFTGRERASRASCSAWFACASFREHLLQAMKNRANRLRCESTEPTKQPRRARPRRAASPRGSRRTPGAATFPRKRARRPRGPTGRAAPGRSVLGHRHGPPPGTALPARRDRSHGEALPPRAGPTPRPAVGPGSERLRTEQSREWALPRSGPAGIASLGPLPARPQEQRAHLQRPPPAEHDCAVVVRADAKPAARVLLRGLPCFSLAVHSPPAARSARHERRCRLAPPRAAALPSPAWALTLA